MSHLRAVCQATIDNPHADGIVNDGGFGLLRQFRFRDHFSTRPGDLSERPEPEWDYSAGGQYNVEPLPELRAVAPRGICDCADMTLYDPATGAGDWQMTNVSGLGNCSNLWKEFYPVGHPRAKHLFFYDSRGAYSSELGYYGEITSRFSFHEDTNFTLEAFRYAPNPTLPQAGYCYLEVNLLGDSQTGQWALVLPVAGTEAQARFPRLGWRVTPGDEWQVLTEFHTDAHEVGALRRKPFEQRITWETIDGHILLNIEGRRQVYYIPPALRLPEGPFIAAGPMRIIVYGHAAIVNVTQVKYPLGELVDCYVERAAYLPVDNTIFTPTPECRSLAWEPEGTAAEASAPKTTEGDEDRYRPRISFTSPHNYRRAVAYLHQLDLPPVISDGESDPYETQGNDVLVSAEGRLTNEWRNAECVVALEMDRADVGGMPEWKGNNKLSVVAGWDDGGSQDAATQFTGYLVKGLHHRDGRRPERVHIDLRARDGFIRLERKYWNNLGSFVEWTLEEAFHRILNQCGIPDGRISFGGDTGLVIPAGARRSEPRFDFPADTRVPDGLNKLVSACGYVWGVDQSGTWFCRPPVEYGDTPDFTLDDDTLAAEDVTFRLSAENIDDPVRTVARGFVNSVFVRIDRSGEPEEAWRRDVASHQDENAADFIGDDWWHVFVGYDEQSASALAERLLAERQQRQKLLHFRCHGKPQLFPDHFVKVQATGIGVPQDSIFRIVRKHWWATSDGEFVTEFGCARIL